MKAFALPIIVSANQFGSRKELLASFFNCRELKSALVFANSQYCTALHMLLDHKCFITAAVKSAFL